MKKKIHDKNMPIGNLKRIKDILPSPDKLVFPKKTKKITIALSEESLNFFKKHAKKNNTQYQKMIRSLLDYYAQHVGN